MLRSWKSEKWETVERLSRATDPSHPGLHQEIMETIRLTTADAIVRYLIAQKSVMPDGSIALALPGVFAIFGHGNVTCWVTRSSSIKTTCRPGATERAGHGAAATATRRRCVVADHGGDLVGRPWRDEHGHRRRSGALQPHPVAVDCG